MRWGAPPCRTRVMLPVLARGSSWLILLSPAGVLDFEEYRLAPAQEGKYVCTHSPMAGIAGNWGGAAHHSVPPPPSRTQEEP